MYVGSLVLFFFCVVLINASSSLPVLNTIVRTFDASYIGRVIKDPIPHYNKYQLWIVVFIGILFRIHSMAFHRGTQKPGKRFWMLVSLYVLVAAIFTGLTTIWISLPEWHYVLMAFAAWFGIISNAHYLWQAAIKIPKPFGTAVAHLGFGIMAIGILASGLNFSYLSNPFVFKGLFGGDGDEEKYIQLIKNKPLLVKDYVITYTNDTPHWQRQGTTTFNLSKEEVTPHPRCLLILFCYPTKRCVFQ